MRLSTDAARDEAAGLATIRAAWDAGVRVFDTAHAYGLGEDDLGHNERLLSRALDGARAFIVTKGGMARPDGAWRPDGRASRLRADCEASVEALGRPIDLYLLHAPDPSTSWATSVRALAKLREDGLVRAVGVCNVNLARLDAALALAPIEAVQVALSVVDDEALLSGVVGRCLERGLLVLAHSPLGGPKRVAKTLRSPTLARVAAPHGVTPAVVALAAVLDLAPNVAVIPGARRPETARDVVRAGRLHLAEGERELLREAFPSLRATAVRPAPAPAPSRASNGEVVMLMGLQGAGKSANVAAWEAKGYARLNRDTAGGTLRELADALERKLREGVTRVVLDNTYVSRKARAPVLDAAARHGVPVRGVWFDTPLHEAQVNVIWRMLDAHGRLLTPDELRRGKDNTTLPPVAQLRMLRELELPAADEGFAALETLSFVRSPRREAHLGARLVALERAGELTATGEPTLVFGWKPDASSAELDALRARLPGEVTLAVCTHGDGPPACWCRPPLPGLLLEFARASGVDLSRSELFGNSPTHRLLAGVVGARFVER